MANPYEQYKKAPATAAVNPYAQYAPTVPSASDPTVAPQDQTTAAISSAAGGLLQNFGDEAKAAVQSALPSIVEAANKKLFDVPEWFPAFLKAPATQAPPVGTYDQELARIRAQAKSNEEAYPLTTGAANIAGNIVGTLPLLGALPAGLTSVSPSLLVNAGKLAGTGVVLGGVGGFGSGEGGFENRAANAVIPAAVGGAVGGLIPFGGAAARWASTTAPGRAIAQNIVDPIVSKIGQYLGGSSGGELGSTAPSVVQSSAMQKLVTAAQRGKFNPEQGQGTLNALGEQGMIADINPALRSVAETAYNMPGQTFAHAGAPGTSAPGVTPGVLEQRALGAPDRMIAALESGGSPQEAATLIDKVYPRNITNVGRTAYGAADEAGLTQSLKLREMLDNPQISAAIKQVLGEDKASRIGRPHVPPMSPIEVMNEVQQIIKKTGFIEGTAIPGPGMHRQQQLAMDYANTLRADNPALDQAMIRYHEAKSLPEFFQTGVGALGKQSAGSEAGIERSVAGVRGAMQGATPRQTDAARAGFINAARMQAEEGTPGALALAKRLTESKPLQQKAETVLTDQRTADELLRQAKAERVFQATDQGIRGNSATARRVANAEEAGAPNIHVRADPRGLLARAYDTSADFLKKIQAPNEAVRDEIGRILLNPNAPQNQEFLQRLAIALQQRQVGTPIRAGLAGSAANQLNQAVQ